MAYLKLACLAFILCGAQAFEVPGLGELAKNILKEKPKPCCIPAVFELSFASQVGYTSQNGRWRGHSGALTLIARIAADFTKGQYGSVVVVFLDDGKVFTYQTIEDTASKSMYIVYDKVCKKLPFDPSSAQQCIPGEATFLDQHTIGNNSLTANTWHLFVNGTMGFYGSANIDTEAKSCIPISVGASGRQYGEKGYVDFMMGGGYSNYTKGVQDRSFWFTPPSFCPTNYSRDNFDAITELGPGVEGVHKRAFLRFF